MPPKRKAEKRVISEFNTFYKFSGDIDIAKAEEMVQKRRQQFDLGSVKKGSTLTEVQVESLSRYLQALQMEQTFLLFGFTCNIEDDRFSLSINFKDITFTIEFLAQANNQMRLTETDIPPHILDAKVLFEKSKGNVKKFVTDAVLQLDCFWERKQFYTLIMENCPPEVFTVQTNDNYTEVIVLITSRAKQISVLYTYENDSATPVIAINATKGRIHKLQMEILKSTLNALHWESLLKTAQLLQE